MIGWGGTGLSGRYGGEQATANTEGAKERMRRTRSSCAGLHEWACICL